MASMLICRRGVFFAVFRIDVSQNEGTTTEAPAALRSILKLGRWLVTFRSEFDFLCFPCWSMFVSTFGSILHLGP